MTTQQQQRPPRDLAAEGFPVGINDSLFSGGSPATDGWHDAVIAEVVDLGIDYKFQKKGDHRGMILIQLDEMVEGGNFEGQRKEARLHISFDMGLGSSSQGTDLRRRLEEWRGAKFTDQEIADMKGPKPLQLAKLVGKPLTVMTAATKAKTSDREFAKVIKFGPANADKTQRLAIAENYVPFHQRSKEDTAASNPRGNTDEAWGEGDSGPQDDNGPGF